MKKSIIQLCLLVSVFMVFYGGELFFHSRKMSEHVGEVEYSSVQKVAIDLNEFTEEESEFLEDDFSETDFNENLDDEFDEPISIKNVPDQVRGIYVTQSFLNSSSGQKKILDLISKTRINALVFDIKDSTGYVFLPKQENEYSFAYKPYSANTILFLQTLKIKNVYLIGRIVVFQDSLLPTYFPESALLDINGSSWKDARGLTFLNPQSKFVWKYISTISKEAKEIGIDEINYDYIRYPSDGFISRIDYQLPGKTTRAEVMKSFFEYLYDDVKNLQGTPISIDIFGDTIRMKGDQGIGQVFENTVPFFDAVSPMVYPSHFAMGVYGVLDPDAEPARVMKYVAEDINKRYDAWCAMQDSEKKDSVCTKNKMRPWIQDFSLRNSYGVKEVQGQIEALESSGISSWLLWNPSFKYTTEAYLKLYENN